jgi:hypothetical protein
MCVCVSKEVEGCWGGSVTVYLCDWRTALLRVQQDSVTFEHLAYIKGIGSQDEYLLKVWNDI